MPHRPMYILEAVPASLDELGRNTQGGRPILAAGQAWPACHCGEQMTLFFQTDIPDDVEHFGGSHLLVFQCPKHNDAAFFTKVTKPLAAGWWDQADQFWRILLNRRGPEAPAGDADPYIQPANLEARGEPELVEGDHGRRAFKLGGVPSWCQDPEHYTCSCGAALACVAMVPENHGFPTTPGQPEQPGWYRAKDWALFLGNEVYLLACSAQCDPRAVWPVNQN